MQLKRHLRIALVVFCLISSLIFNNPVAAYDNPDLLPNYQTPVIDLANSLTLGQKSKLELELNDYEQSSGWKIRVLTQFESTPGMSIKDFWNIDDRTLLIVADPRGGNLINFNVGDAYFALMPRIFWVELQTRFGNQFYVRDNGEDRAIINSIKTVEKCLDRGGCNQVPGITKEQLLWTLAASILGGLIAGIASSPRKSNQVIAWKWLFLVSPIWIIPFGVIGIAQVATRTNELIPVLRNIVAFIASAIAANIFAKNSLGKNIIQDSEE